jgi:glycosyltransferase involved in cell wall biosynthesis
MVADAVDVEQFAQHVQTLDRNPALRQRLSLAAYELYRQMTDPKVYRQSLLDAL